jgi:hypothetical protein
MRGYNFANVDGAFPIDENFPENEGLRERMLTERIKREEWVQWTNNGSRPMLFTNDRQMNAFRNYEVNKILADGGNPYDYLANRYTNADGIECDTHVMWEFEAMFDQGLNYENDLLRYLHAMMPDFCPNGVNDTRSDCLFRLARDNDSQDDNAPLATGFNRGVLQMQVPYELPAGFLGKNSPSQTRYLWANVYVGLSFFGEEYSGFSRPNIDGASNYLDAMNTAAYYGNELDERRARQRKEWATSDMGRSKPPRDGGAWGKA